MVLRYAVASGNWSSTSTWNGGTLPASGDDVYANNFTVTVDQDITANRLRNVASSPAVAGGRFVVASGGRTLTLALGIDPADIASVSSNPLIEITASTGTVNVIGGSTPDIYGGGASGAYGIQVSSAATGVTVNVTADLNGGSAAAAMCVKSATAVIVINEPLPLYGTLYGSSTAAGLLLDNSSATVTLNGAVYGATGTASSTVAGLVSIGTGSPTIIVNNDVLCESTGYCIAIANTGGAPTVTVNGAIHSRPAGGVAIYAERGDIIAKGAIFYEDSRPPVLGIGNGASRLLITPTATVSIRDSVTGSYVSLAQGGTGGAVRPVSGMQWPLPR